MKMRIKKSLSEAKTRFCRPGLVVLGLLAFCLAGSSRTSSPLPPT